MFPCLAETYQERVALTNQALLSGHGLDYDELSDDIESIPTDVEGEDMARSLDYDGAIRAFLLYGAKHVPAGGTMMWCPRITSPNQAADLIAQRVFLRKHTNFCERLEELLEPRISDYVTEKQEAQYDSGSDPEDVRHYENVDYLVNLKIIRQIVRLEKSLLEGGLPDRWPWQADPHRNKDSHLG